jgi:hypothetical protein
VPAEMYKYGTQYWACAISGIIVSSKRDNKFLLLVEICLVTMRLLLIAIFFLLLSRNEKMTNALQVTLAVCYVFLPVFHEIGSAS